MRIWNTKTTTKRNNVAFPSIFKTITNFLYFLAESSFLLSNLMFSKVEKSLKIFSEVSETIVFFVKTRENLTQCFEISFENRS